MQNRFISLLALSVLATLLSSCSDSPTAAPPAVVVNTPPTIDSLVAATERAEADRPLQMTAVIKDAESQPGTLTYTWSASPLTGTFGGTTSFVGSEASNTWRPPKGQKTPDLYTVMLAVTEAYTSAGQAKQNTASKSTTLHYNDSPIEVAALGRDFLVNKFGNFNVTPAEAVSGFSDSCKGKAEELDDVKDNREFFHILSASFTPLPPTFNSDLTAGTVGGNCQFEDIPNAGQPNGGKREFVSGTCVLKTVYENFRWYLCESSFEGPYQTTLASLKGRVPGRIVLP